MNTLYRNKDWLYLKYWEDNLSTVKMAEICGVEKRTIRDWMKRHNIARRTHRDAQLVRFMDVEARRKCVAALTQYYKKPFLYYLYKGYFKRSFWYCLYKTLKEWLKN